MDRRSEVELDEIGPAQWPTSGSGEHQRLPVLRPVSERGGNFLSHRARQPDRARLVGLHRPPRSGWGAIARTEEQAHQVVVDLIKSEPS